MSGLGNIRVGISGWRYKGWRGSFYPMGLPQRAELGFAAGRFNSIELNGSFYSLQRPESFQRWFEETPPGFVFAIKGSRFVTHMKRLLGVEVPIANFFAQGLLCLREKLGPILWQIPANFTFVSERLDRFFSMLPRTHKEASSLGKHHDHRLDGRDWLRVTEDRPLRHAIEIRNDTFVCEEFIGVLRKHRVALVVADTVEWPLLMDVTADFVYCRLHGSEQLYASGYDPNALDRWAGRVVRWARGGEVDDGKKASAQSAVAARSRDIYVYFDNDAKVRAPFDAQSLSQRIAKLTEGAAV